MNYCEECRKEGRYVAVAAKLIKSNSFWFDEFGNSVHPHGGGQCHICGWVLPPRVDVNGEKTKS